MTEEKETDICECGHRRIDHAKHNQFRSMLFCEKDCDCQDFKKKEE